MVQSQDDCEVRRRLSPKGQVSLPGEVRKALGLRPGDSVVFEITDGVVTIRRADGIDPFFHLPLFQALEEWSQDQKATVFRYP
jgi:AbrB family looped-hinge helix DNA binding protein